MSIWGPGGVLRQGCTCSFCEGLGAHMMMDDGTLSYTICTPCGGSGASPLASGSISIGRSQTKFLRTEDGLRLGRKPK